MRSQVEQLKSLRESRWVEWVEVRGSYTAYRAQLRAAGMALEYCHRPWAEEAPGTLTLLSPCCLSALTRGAGAHLLCHRCEERPIPDLLQNRMVSYSLRGEDLQVELRRSLAGWMHSGLTVEFLEQDLLREEVLDLLLELTDLFARS